MPKRLVMNRREQRSFVRRLASSSASVVIGSAAGLPEASSTQEDLVEDEPVIDIDAWESYALWGPIEGDL